MSDLKILIVGNVPPEVENNNHGRVAKVVWNLGNICLLIASEVQEAGIKKRVIM